jgi:Flp pilus assembly CpaE family ATPase
MRVLVLVIGAFPVIVWDMVHNHGAWSNSLAATLQHGLRGIGAL